MLSFLDFFDFRRKSISKIFLGLNQRQRSLHSKHPLDEKTPAIRILTISSLFPHPKKENQTAKRSPPSATLRNPVAIGRTRMLNRKSIKSTKKTFFVDYSRRAHYEFQKTN